MKFRKRRKPDKMDGRARVIFADPNWQYQNWTDAKHGAAAAHYNCASVEDIGKIPVSRWADPSGCILLLWATGPKLPQAFEVARLWGWEEYVTWVPWVKTRPNTGNIHRGVGFWTQGAAELLLIFRRGKVTRDRTDPNIGLLEGGKGMDAVFYSPVGKHSAKPESLQAWVERGLEGPYVELFAREKRKGWHCWGFDTGWALTSRGRKRIK